MPHILREYNEFDQFIADARKNEAEVVFKELERANCLYTTIGNDPRFGTIEMHFKVDRPHIGGHNYHYSSQWRIDGNGNSTFRTEKKPDLANLLVQLGADESDLIALKKVQGQRLRKLCETEENTGDETKKSRFEETTDKTAEFKVRTKDWGELHVRVLMNESFGNTSFRYELLVPAQINEDIPTFDKKVVDAGIRICKGKTTIIDHSTVR